MQIRCPSNYVILAADDFVGVTGYRIVAGGKVLASTSEYEKKVTLSDLEVNTNYTFMVEAGDASGNWSTSGPSVTVHTSMNQE
ncbi:hypothetical protein [Paenibacillus sedimenti]|uniref:Fibronectin type-III domain-containing protein n=1 Tax=Paenibacillus sedimenti TaxID=2770274 RepID=A0A926KS82_9BACL|nr:hypothetical protein [Paenibacillus sedimenti]MBD0383147.1 hypothetical protein [Paenibacillus sedimenti]